MSIFYAAFSELDRSLEWRINYISGSFETLNCGSTELVGPFEQSLLNQFFYFFTF